MKENTWKALIAVIVGGLSAYMQQILIPLIVLAAVMVIDYMSGMLRAWAQEQLSSRIGVKGIVKKLCYLLLICVAGVVDWLIYSGLRKVGISLDFGFCFGDRGFDLGFHQLEVLGYFINHQCCQFFYKGTEISCSGILVAKK